MSTLAVYDNGSFSAQQGQLAVAGDLIYIVGGSGLQILRLRQVDLPPRSFLPYIVNGN